MKSIEYKEGYCYQLARSYIVEIDIRPEADIKTPWISLSTESRLTVKKGYAWDGPSGPAIDTRNFMRGSLVHDALYQLMRERLLSQEYRERADRLMQRMCIEDGMSRLRAWWVYQGVRFGGGPSADPQRNDNPVMTAP